MRAADGPAWDGLVQRGMAVDFDWDRGSAPRYVALYERAAAIRRGRTAG
jgi:glycogen synthase